MKQKYLALILAVMLLFATNGPILADAFATEDAEPEISENVEQPSQAENNLPVVTSTAETAVASVSEPEAEPVPEQKESANTEESTETQEPVNTEKPSESQEPADTEEPTETQEPADTEEPSESQEPAGTEEPTETQDPTDTEEPTETQEPADTEEPTETPEPTDIPTAISAELTAVSLYGYVNSEAVNVLLRLDGGAAPYTVNIQSYEQDELVEEATDVVFTAGEFSYSHMPGQYGVCVMKAIVTDAAGQTWESSVSVPVAAPDRDNGREFLKRAAKVQLTGDWAEDLLAVAASQIGYRESEIDFTIDEDGKTQGYTIYGDWYGAKYSEWCAMFVSWALNQAGIAKQDFPQKGGCQKLLDEVRQLGIYGGDAGVYEPKPGDIVFFNWDEKSDADHVGIVEKVSDDEIETIEGNSGKEVRRNRYARNDGHIMGYASMEKAMIRAGVLKMPEEILEPVEDPAFEELLEYVYNCGLEEHSHSETCYDEAGTQTCGLEEHVHTEECVAAELTAEEQAQVEEVIALIEALPTQEEIGENLAAFEDAGDEDGYDAYLMEIIAQAKAAYGVYSLLTEAQQGQVTNVDRLLALEPLWSVQTLADFPALTDDSAYVTGITVDSISDGTAPFEDDDSAGNDSGTTNKIVRTFDTVTYNFTVNMESYGNGTYSEARVKLEFVLPLTADQATFDQGAMAWMDQAEGYKPVLTTETRTIDGVDTTCQVLTCYKRLLPSGDHPSVVPGTFGEMVVVNVKSMKNGDTFAPIFSACMEHGTWEGDCPDHNQTEKATVVADEVTVSAAPKYNIRIYGTSSYKSTFDFSTGNDIAQTYGEGYGKGNVTGRVAKYGIVVQLYNDNASKGLKGIELPEGDITFDLKVSSQYRINDPNDTDYNQGDTINTTADYLPLLWSCDGNKPTVSGSANSDGRVLYDTHGSAQAQAPYNKGDGDNACYDGGTWTATQNGDTIHVTVSGYQINIDSMPTTQGDTTNANNGYYGVDLGIGCFSAGELWLVQPYNKIGENSDNEGPEFDVLKDYGEGKFDTSVQVINMKATTISGATLEDGTGTNDAQMKKDDDYASVGVELLLPGKLQNRVAYANPTNFNKGVGVDSYRDGLDFATVGTGISLLGGFSYNHQYEPDNQLYWGTNLTKFYGSAIEVTADTNPSVHYSGGADAKEWTVYYATKQDGKDWASDDELLTTYEDSLVFYKSLSEIPSGHLCVGLLFCFKEDTYSTSISEPYFFIQQPAKVRDDMDLSGESYIMVSTSRVWTKSMFEQANMTLDGIPDWTNSATTLDSFPSGYYKSGNITGSTWYVKTDYSQATSGIVRDHNSDWRHWGDTLLVIGYKTGITKTLCQTSDNTAKNTYNLDAEQRVVDFKLQPRTYYDQGDSNHELTTTVTIVDTLPKYLTYRAGSGYFGGTYTQTSSNGGTQGTVTGGTLREPDSFKTNADGTQTLTWVITDVKVGEEMPVIYYSANIGDRNNSDKDVPTGTTNLVNQVRISATHDMRQPTLANGNYAEVGIAVTRGAASSYGKYSAQDVVEADGQIDYVIYYDNNAVTVATKPVLVDAMPVNGVLGSNFTGTWIITSFKISLVGTNTTLADLDASLHYTTDSEYEGKDLAYLQEHQDDTNENWEDAAIGTDGTVPVLNGKTPVMWVLNCESLPGNSELRVEYTIQLIPAPGSTLDNIKYVNQFSTSNTTTTTETPVVKRTLEGLTWMDDNGDGIQDEADTYRISGVKVELLKLKDGGDPVKESDYEPYHYQGNSELPVVQIETGQQISVRAGSASDAEDDEPKVYELGRYKFTDLPAGTFAVRFTDGNPTKISSWLASPSNQGNDDTKDSDGIATYTANHATLEKTVILGIDMPAAEKMSVQLFESKYHDSGFYKKGYELPATGGHGARWYELGGLALMACALIHFVTRRRREDN